MARVLVVEDNMPNLQLMVYLLSAFGHEPVSALDGEECLNLLEVDGDFALILCDIHLPRLDGYGVARRLKTAGGRFTRIPLVAVTALAMVGDRDKVLSAGFDGYITKPIAPETFVSQMEAFLQPAQRGAREVKVGEESGQYQVANVPTQSARVLVVDDTPANVELIRSILESAGYPVQTATKAREAMKIVEAWSPAVVVSDLHMPDGGGLDLLRAIRARNPTVQISFVMTSASAPLPGEREACVQVGVSRFVDLPLEPNELLAELEGCLRGLLA